MTGLLRPLLQEVADLAAGRLEGAVLFLRVTVIEQRPSLVQQMEDELDITRSLPQSIALKSIVRNQGLVREGRQRRKGPVTKKSAVFRKTSFYRQGQNTELATLGREPGSRSQRLNFWILRPPLAAGTARNRWIPTSRELSLLSSTDQHVDAVSARDMTIHPLPQPTTPQP